MVTACLVLIWKRSEATLEFDDPINIQYTSGTTGAAKGATLSHHNVLNNGFLTGQQMGLTEYDRLSAPVPPYHCFGCVAAVPGCLTHGACLVLSGECFEPEAVLQTIQEEQCTALFGVPKMFIMELDHPRLEEYDLSTLRTGIMGGAACPVELMKQVQYRMNVREVTVGCGMTETSPVSTQTAADDPLDKRIGSVGRAPMDDEGYVKIVGRIKDMLIRGGENIYPRNRGTPPHTPAHQRRAGHRCAGHGVRRRDHGVGQAARRCGSLGGGAEGVCKDRIASPKIPRYWRFVDGFPMTIAGKLQKFPMRELAISELTRRDNRRISRRAPLPPVHTFDGTPACP